MVFTRFSCILHGKRSLTASRTGGRGSAFSALIGIVVIQSISSGLTLLNLDSSVQFMVTGVVLVLAVIVDSLSRRTRAATGRA